MPIADLNLWQWLALLQHELLLFAGIFFLIGAVDDLAIDIIWLWLRLTGRGKAKSRKRAALVNRPLHAPAAVIIPTWNEAAVTGDTITHLLASWPHPLLRLCVGCYHNDPATLAAATAAAESDPRLRLVIHNCDGPSTKADCLNRLYRALVTDEQRSGRRFAMVVFHDAEDMVDPAALGLLDECVAFGADFVQLPVEPLVQRHGHWFANQLGNHYCEEFAEAHGKGLVVRDWLGVGLPGAGVGCAAGGGGLRSNGWRRGVPMVSRLRATPSLKITSLASALLLRAGAAGSCGCGARMGGWWRPAHFFPTVSTAWCARRAAGCLGLRCRDGTGSAGVAGCLKAGCARVTGAARWRHWCCWPAMRWRC